MFVGARLPLRALYDSALALWGRKSATPHLHGLVTVCGCRLCSAAQLPLAVHVLLVYLPGNRGWRHRSEPSKLEHAKSTSGVLTHNL
jgi:hypothetical protein